MHPGDAGLGGVRNEVSIAEGTYLSGKIESLVDLSLFLSTCGPHSCEGLRGTPTRAEPGLSHTLSLPLLSLGPLVGKVKGTRWRLSWVLPSVPACGRTRSSSETYAGIGLKTILSELPHCGHGYPGPRDQVLLLTFV